jgi:hypothetical protein
VCTAPGCFSARNTGRLLTRPPRKTATITCSCTDRVLPLHPYGENISAIRIPKIH